MRHTQGKGQKEKRTLGSILACRKGMTLVELVVTFALMVLFAVGTIQLISTSVKVYYEIRDLDNARQVSDTLMEKIVGEIAGAQVGLQYEIESGVTLRINREGTQVELYDKTGSPIAITTENNRLLIRYKPVQNYDEVKWTYDEKAYMGYEIKSLIFARADQEQYPLNVLKVDMELSHGRYGVFSTTRYVECYNFTTERDFDRIEDEGHPVIKPPETEAPETDPPETDPPETDPPETDPPETDPPETDPPETEPPTETETETEAIIEPPNPEGKKYFRVSGGSWFTKKNFSVITKNATKYAINLVREEGDYIIIPMGLYYDNSGKGEYYFVPEDVVLSKSEIPGKIADLYKRNKDKCMLVWDNKGVEGTGFLSGLLDFSVDEGFVLEKNEKYYLCKRYTVLPIFANPANAAKWFDITTFVE